MPLSRSLQVLSWRQGHDAAHGFDAIDPSVASLLREALAAAQIPAVVLATCHRFEIYWAGAPARAETVRDVCRRVVGGGLPPDADFHAGERALEHAMTVASGMQSLRRGEPEILGQVRAAWLTSQAAGTSSVELDRVLQRVIAASRHIRRHLGVAAQWSIGDATVRLLECELAGPHVADEASVLIIGAGAVGASVAESLHRARREARLDRVRSVRITNRTAERASELSARCGAEPLSWNDWHDALVHADIVVTAARSASPLIDQTVAARVALARRAPAVWIDLASPRNIAPDVATPACAVLTLHDLPRNDALADAAAQQALQGELARLREAQRQRESMAGRRPLAARVASSEPLQATG